MAKLAGADAVKFQLYNHKALYGIAGIPDENVVDNWLPGTLPVDWLPRLKECADQVGIEFLCSAFSPELLDVVNPFVETHKLASAEMEHVGMLDKLIEYDKPVIVSTGGHTIDEVKRVVEYLNGLDICVMYCVSEYPARFIQYSRILALKELEKPLGFSDHTLDMGFIGRHLSIRNVNVFEKHVNFVNVKDTPDAPHSLSFDEFKLYVKSLHWKLRDDDVQLETAMREKHNRRLIATTTIKAGETLQLGVNYGIYRSLKPAPAALSPWKATLIDGKRAAIDIQAGDGIAGDSITD